MSITDSEKPLDKQPFKCYTIPMSIEQRISLEAMERCLKAHRQGASDEETAKIAYWANNQLSLVSLWQRTGVKPTELEF